MMEIQIFTSDPPLQGASRTAGEMLPSDVVEAKKEYCGFPG